MAPSLRRSIFALVPLLWFLLIDAASPTSHDVEIRQRIAGGVKAFEAENLRGLLVMVSDFYRSGPITKEALRLQLLGIFQANRELRVALKIHEIRVRGDLVYVRSSGEVTGQPLFWPYRVVIFEWEDLVEVGRREGPVWRLYGDQQ